MSPARVLVVDDSPTILKVVSSILSRHGFKTETARDGVFGMEVLAKGPPFDLVLLDFVMPRMNGYQFCRELRSHPTLRRLPVVLMSAKGDRIRGQFVQQTGAVDAITKPFDARALVAVVEGALAKTAEGRARPVPEGDTMPDEDTLADSVRPSIGPRTIKAKATIDFARELSGVLVPAILSLSPDDRAGEAPIMRAVASALSPEVVQNLARSLRDYTSADLAREVLAGEIEHVSIAEILQVLSMQRQTGALRVTSGQVSSTVTLREGAVDFVQTMGGDSEFRIGRYFVEKGVVSRDSLDKAAQSDGPKLLGERLVALGKASADDLHEALVRQSSELFYEMLRWRRGRFVFTKELPSREAAAARLSLGVSGLVLEGYRRVDEWRHMEGAINFDDVLVTDEVTLDGVGRDKLTRAEELVIAAIDGKRTISEVLRMSDVGSFDAIKAVHQLMKTRLLRARS